MGDSHTVERSAHGLKGAVANFGAEAVVTAALKLEQMGRAKNLDGFPAALEALERALADLNGELHAL
jgi:HPt (histidine-containing phosphotransfer) domain-containing protein